MSIKEAIDKYFSKLKMYSQKVYDANPTVSYTDELNKTCLVSVPDEDNEVEWEPVSQKTQIIWDEMEDWLGFKLCDELKDYYSTYSWLMISGRFGDSYLNFYPIDAIEPVIDTIKREYEDAQEFFCDSQCFLIGNAIVNEDDGYFIFFDNKKSKLFCYEEDTKHEVLLSYSIAKIIGALEARL